MSSPVPVFIQSTPSRSTSTPPPDDYTDFLDTGIDPNLFIAQVIYDTYREREAYQTGTPQLEAWIDPSIARLQPDRVDYLKATKKLVRARVPRKKGNRRRSVAERELGYGSWLNILDRSPNSTARYPLRSRRTHNPLHYSGPFPSTVFL